MRFKSLRTRLEGRSGAKEPWGCNPKGYFRNFAAARRTASSLILPVLSLIFANVVLGEN